MTIQTSHSSGQSSVSKTKVKNLLNLSDNQIFFVWHILGGPWAPEGNMPNDLEQIIDAIDDILRINNLNQELINSIYQNLTYYVVTDEYIEWIDKNNKRLLLNILSRLNHYNNYGHVDFIIPTYQAQPNFNQVGFTTGPTFTNNNLYYKFKLEFDRLKINSTQKVNILAEIKYYWTQIMQNNKTNKWIKENDTEQLYWAWNYLQKNNKAIYRFDSLISDSDYYHYILASLDYLIFLPPAEHILFLDRMKRTWSQKKFRDSGKAKKPFHLPLTKDTHKKIEFLEGYLNKSKSQVIEYLVEVEFQKTQTDEHGNKKYF